MLKTFMPVRLFLALALLILSPAFAAKKGDNPDGAVGEITGTVRTMLWREPNNIGTRNLFFGPGGKEHAPHGKFTFLKEDRKGSNPKFDAEDQDGVKWKVKLGSESRPETVASRLVWAVGYFADEDFFLPTLHVTGMEFPLRRAKTLVDPDGTVHDVRLKRERKGVKKIGVWRWRKDPFSGTRELNGLRVMMALLNNWDVKDENNAIFETKSGKESDETERIYEVSDLGATFGAVNLTRQRWISKGNLDLYTQSRFIRKIESDYVDFEVPHRPAVVVLVNPHEFFSRLRLEWIGRHIPRADARWIGQLLARLSPDQIRDAFRAAGYSPQVVEGFATVLESRIAELNKL